ncbi:MAG: dipeptide epimerase [Verrucomicrobiota bacterium]
MKLNIRRVELTSTHPWKIARTAGGSHFEVCILELTDSNGLTGRGEAAPVSRYNESVSTVEAFLSQVDPNSLPAQPGDIPAYLQSLGAGNMSAKCAIDIALLDLFAKRNQQPLSDFLGLGFREGQHTTSFTIGIDAPQVITAKVIAAQEFPVLKMKMGGTDDKQNLRALRAAASAKPIRIDANEGWTSKEQALAMIEWLATNGNVQFVEQPMPASAPVADWVWLKKRSPLPLFADESYHLQADAEKAAECFDGVNVKLVKTGGIMGAVEALRAARRLGLKTMLGCMIETSVLISAAAHLAELCDYLDLDGNLLFTNDPYLGVTAKNGVLSFADSPEPTGLRVRPRNRI